jgi:RND family efflux transporter MFP subunit
LRAEAGVLQANATSERADRELARYEQLVASGVGSKQDLDRVRADATIGKATIKVAQANVTAERANVQRLVLLKSYSTLTSPFAGMVTSRTIERGALVTTGNTVPLFKIAATDTVRVMLQLPQNIAPSIKVGQVAKVLVREFPTKPFEGKVAHVAGALDPATRTMLTEIRVPNPEHSLLGGMYVQVALTLPTPHRVLELPATALVNDAKGLRVAVVDSQDVVHLIPVELERDTGAAIEIASGLKGDERVIKLASADLVEGRKVQVVP